MIDLQSLPWERKTLVAIARAERELGVKIYAISSLAYGPIWGGRFGPLVAAYDADVSVADTSANCDEVFNALKRSDPTIRWAVSHASISADWLGVPVPKVTMDIAPLTCQQIGVRLVENGTVEVTAHESGLRDLENGIVRLNENVWVKNPEHILAIAISRTRSFIEKFPGLKVEGMLAEKIGWTPKTIISPSEMSISVQRAERGGRPSWNNPRHFDSTAHELLSEIARHQATGWKPPESRPWHPASFLPTMLQARMDELEEARKSVPILPREERERIATINPPEGYQSWLHFVATHGSDNEWREWLAEQIRSRYPVGGKDREVQFLMKKTKGGEQKLTHMGMPLWLHLLHGALELRTDEIRSRVNSGIIAALRCGMLAHDIGKLQNSDTPGAHQGIGVKMFRKLAKESDLFSWLPNIGQEIVEWVITHHDIFGRFARGVGEKEFGVWGDSDFDPLSFPKYRGALGLLDVQKRIGELEKLPIPRQTSIRIARLVWEADVGSVPTLRWILPQAKRIESLVLCT